MFLETICSCFPENSDSSFPNNNFLILVCSAPIYERISIEKINNMDYEYKGYGIMFV